MQKWRAKSSSTRLNNSMDAVDKVASEKGESLTIEHHSTGHWTEWLVEDETGIRHYHCVGIGYVKF
ncbi:hypothetical protein WA1_23230 [Scytonema hofmannii PCC 7110]|uniref:Uncharacterized protein n=1 Tax=Scytonema hofmannii PCC 7110 TaxID=128403 RepID=A0A139X8T8_9CYAN|nr:hypothetical protein WA1_23230 [Scytonema hofmannii PCC 7110]